MIGNPSGVVDRFCPDDVRLLETLANNTSVVLENDRLGQTVWRLKGLQRELEHQASHDPLTDLANRSLFVQRVGESLRSGRCGVGDLHRHRRLQDRQRQPRSRRRRRAPDRDRPAAARLCPSVRHRRAARRRRVRDRARPGGLASGGDRGDGTAQPPSRRAVLDRRPARLGARKRRYRDGGRRRGEPGGADPERRLGDVSRQARGQAPLRAVRVGNGGPGEESPPSQGAAARRRPR